MRLRTTFSAALFMTAAFVACGSESAPSPFGAPGGAGAGGEGAATGAGGFALDVGGGPAREPIYGGPCEDDGQCDDQIDCTVDSCDPGLKRCRFAPDDSQCEDDVYCDGSEICDAREGCVEGEPVACSDDNTCTIDTCVESTQSCRHVPRDADGDGDPTRNCGGSDCDDQNPLVHPGASEICDNATDDDCDGEVDEEDCTTPAHDSCDDALQIETSGLYQLSMAAAALDYPTPCQKAGPVFRDAVIELLVPEGGPFDVDVSAKADRGQLSLATSEGCGALEAARCDPGYSGSRGSPVSRLVLRELGPGSYPVYVAHDQEDAVQLSVVFREPEQKGLADRCEEALELIEGEPAFVRLVDLEQDVESACGGETGDAFLRFTLGESRDVVITAQAEDDLGVPVLTLMDASCREQRTCRIDQPARIFERALPAGEHVLALAGTGPSDVTVWLDTSSPSEPPDTEGCINPPLLEPGVEQIVDLSVHVDSVTTRCLPGAADASFALELDEARDVLLVGRFSDGDAGAVSFIDAACEPLAGCAAGANPVRFVERDLAAGQHRIAIESVRGNPVGLRAFFRQPVTPTFVPFADDCATAFIVPEYGGRYLGNTASSFPDYVSSCDAGGQAPGGAPDQMLRLELTRAHRVILNLSAADPTFVPLLSVRGGESCPGSELPRACVPALAGGVFLELELEKGDYFIQVDGFDGSRGAWELDVFTTPL
jgi:hypothetical protein